MEFSVNSLTILNSWAEPLLRAGVFYILDHSSHDERMSVPYRNIYVRSFTFCSQVKAIMLKWK